MKMLKFRANKTKKQQSSLTTSKVYNLNVISEYKNSFNEISIVATDNKNNYLLSQWELNEFSMRKIKESVDVDGLNAKMIESDVMNMVNHSINGRIINYFKIK